MSTEDWVDVSDSTTTAAPATATAPTKSELDAYIAFVQSERAATVYQVGELCYVLRHPSAFHAEAKQAARLSSNCNACIHRAGIYVRDSGPCGPVFFACAPAAPSMSIGDINAVNELRALATKTCAQDASELVVVTSTTYAPVIEGCSPCGEPYYHWTVHPSNVSTPEAAARFDKLKHYYSGQMDARLAKLTVPEAVESVHIMLEEQPSLERPGHYASVLRWVSGVQTLAREQCTSGDGSFEAMTHADQARLRVLALMSGRVDGATHLDFHQADNIVDFCLLPSRDALRAEMDRRSDPQYYMVSQLNRRLAQAGVTSKWLIGLTWDGRFTDDLDIHVTVPSGKEINFSNKKADGCTLDFDANVSKGEANPCENVSVVPGKYTVRVNNFTRRTFGEPIPFQIVCRQQGSEDVVYDAVWGVNRTKNQYLYVCTHTFTPLTDELPAAMSTKGASRATALDSEWSEHIGDPKATIATTEALTGQPGIDVLLCMKGSAAGAACAPPTPAQVGRSFMDMALQAKDANGACVADKKPFLSQSCRAKPQTVRELVAYMEAHPSAQLAVHPRDHAPGYMVSVQAKSAGVRKDERPAPCHFHDKFAFPAKPVAGSVGNARLDASWMTMASTNGFVRVAAVVTGAVDGGCTFLALQGATLPRRNGGRGAGEAVFPLSSGFYPTDLSAAFVKHRERWTYYHTQMQPCMPPAVAAGVPLVGTFLTGATAVVYLDGVKMTVRC